MAARPRRRIKLAELVNAFDGDNGELWTIGEHGECCLDDVIVGAYWHYTEWHSGMWSKGYLALSLLGDVFDPGMTVPDRDNAAFFTLNELAKASPTI